MQYYVRVAIGFALGALLAVGFGLFTGNWIPAGGLGALVGIAGFLATFFVWSADRLPEYEQVLFDGRNTLHALIMGALLVGVAFGATHVTLPFSKSPAAPADPVAAKMDADHDALTHIYNDVQSSKLDAAGLAAARATVAGVQSDLDSFPAGEHATLLAKAAKAIASALDAYEKCGTKACQQSTLALLDAKKPLNDYTA